MPDIVLPSLYDALEIGEEFLPKALPWSQVRSAYYRTWTEPVNAAIPELRSKSESRMAGNPAFTTFLAQRDRIHKRMNNPEVSLKLADRVVEIAAEKELDKLQDEPLDSKKADKEDPILDETIQIVTDLVDFAGGKSGTSILTKTGVN